MVSLAVVLAGDGPCHAASGPDGSQGDKKSLVLGIHPYLPPQTIVRRFGPLADYLGKRLGMEVRINVSMDYAVHIDNIGAGKVDIAYMGPASYVLAVRKYGPLPILASLEVDGRNYFQGVIIRRQGSVIEDISQLRGKRFAFGDPDSTMSHLVPRYMLLQAGVGLSDLGGYEYLSNHDNVALGVLVGDFDAGAVKEEVFYKYRGRGLEAMTYTPEIHEHLFVARTDLSGKLLNAFRSAMWDLHGDEALVREMLEPIKSGITGLVPVEDRDYDNLREILDALKKAMARH